VNNEDVCKKFSNKKDDQTPKMHMFTTDKNKDGHNNIGVTQT